MTEGAVVTTFKIMPEGIEANLDKLEEDLKKKIKPTKIQRVPIAFGLNSVIIVKVIEEKEGELERVTEEIRSIEGVREVEITNLARSW